MPSILHISTTDRKGGSGRSAYRIHRGLLNAGCKSRMLVGQQAGRDPDIDLISKGMRKTADRICGGILNRLSLQDVYYPSSFALRKRDWYKEADIVQLYNIHGNYFAYSTLPILSVKKPIVWRLSDMWPITGHCGYSYDCEKWKTGCGHCPYLNEYPSLRNDRTAFLWRLKNKCYQHIQNMVIVAPSLWIKKLAGNSPLLNKLPIFHIPNGVNTNVFKEENKNEARKLFNLNVNDKVVLFVAEQLHTDKRKGGEYLIKALALLAEPLRKEIVLLMVGKETIKGIEKLTIRYSQAGYIENDEQLAKLYQAADVMVLPTLAENLPNTILESMACGTPVVGFNIGGLPEVIRHKETGYLAKYKDVQDLAAGIKHILEDKTVIRTMSSKAAAEIRSNYQIENEIKKYCELYEQVLKNNNKLKRTN